MPIGYLYLKTVTSAGIVQKCGELFAKSAQFLTIGLPCFDLHQLLRFMSVITSVCR